ncbi:[protein-PII] uridylyltransferase [Corynebacterium sp. ES2715-CONJ3]|uniref:[protein-PII] uridylyltransferase n=1 Tax=Corynebacterium sp. ES2715-CONJ3 TaxID=2974028 RepID=UPI002168B03C|nr:[protein-PII] uridylyltransferase [Corynebacterium sp. ES2715-CONJ3]MCS4490885.1 [protein-PII] uridylyltransferase [Corynebacterium sp. ES2715-CONJ3]
MSFACVLVSAAPRQFSSVRAHDIRDRARARAAHVLANIRLPKGSALAATGSLARGELQPQSDLDLVLIYDGTIAAENLQDLWYPVWDASFRLDHAVRTRDECVSLVNSDPTAALALLELKHIRGDKELTSATRDAVLRRWRVHLNRNFNAFVDLAIARWRRSGSVVAMTRPDLKHGRGGLRDHEFLRALALGHMVDIPDLSKERALLVDSRTLLHYHARRARDVLDPEFAVDVAEDLGYSDRYALSRDLAHAAHRIDGALTTALASTRHLLRRNSPARSAQRRPLDIDVVEENGEITLARQPNLGDPGLVLRVAAAGARTGMPIRRSVWRQLITVPRANRHEWTKTMTGDFFALLSSPDHSARVILELDEYGLWENICPGWGRIRGMLPREPTHIHTVDRHSLKVLEFCARSRGRVSRPDLLFLSALYHDIGKGHHRSHQEVGAQMVVEMAQTLKLSAQDQAVVHAVVLHHTLIPRLIATQDIESDNIRDTLLDTLGYNFLVLELLEVLVAADAQATGPGVWSPALQSGSRLLISKARAQLHSHQPRPPVIRYRAGLDLLGGEESQARICWEGEYWRESIRLFALIAAKGWTITEADFIDDGSRGKIIAELTVYNTLGTGFDKGEFIQAYKSGVYSALPPVTRSDPVTYWHGDILEIRTSDRRAALGTLMGVLPDLHWLSISTPGATIIVVCSLKPGYERAAVDRDVTRVLSRG